MKIAKLYRVKGRVQGVGYRFFVEHAASELKLSGYVKNLSDGRVEVYAIGSDDTLSDLRSKLERGPVASRVEGIEEQDVPVGKQKKFSIEG